MKIRFVSLVSGWLAVSALAASGTVGYGSFSEMVADDNFTPLPVERLTDGPAFHWKAYYDVPKIDPTGRYLLCMESDFENRSPLPDDAIRIGIIDLQDNNQWTTIGTSRAWCWQQGCRLQWRGQKSGLEVVWNDRDGDHFVTRVYNTQTQQTRTLPKATYDISSDGQWAFGLNFARTDDMRQGYGYEGVADPNEDQLAPLDDGIYRMDMDTGKSEMLFSIHDIAMLHDGDEITRKIYFNHIECAPGDQRIFFLSLGERKEYAFSANFDGSDIRCIAAGGPSHYNWRDANSTLIFIGGMFGNYTLFQDNGSRKGKIQWAAQNGHQTHIPGGEWIITDTYPQSRDKRFQWIYLYHIPTGRCVPVGKFNSPGGYTRCDLHPYLSPDGRTVVFDSTHEGMGRQLYKVDIGSLLQESPALKASR